VAASQREAAAQSKDPYFHGLAESHERIAPVKLRRRD